MGKYLFILPEKDKWEGSDFLNQVEEHTRKHDDAMITFGPDTKVSIRDNKLSITLSDGTEISKDSDNLPDFVIMRNPSRINILYAFEQLGVKCFPATKMSEIANNKIRSHIFALDAFPQPDSELNITEDYAQELKDEQYPLILKGTYGCGGKSIFKVNGKDEFQDSFDAAMEDKENQAQDMFLQKCMPTGDDLRVYIMFDEILAAIVRHVPDGQFKANLENHPTREIYELSDNERESIENFIASLPEDHGFCCVDFLFNDDGTLTMCEMNANPGIQTLVAQGLSENVVDRYVELAKLSMERD